MYQDTIDSIRRVLAIGLLHVILITICIAIARLDLLPFDLSRMPLSIVTLSQCCVFAIWSTHGLTTLRFRGVTGIGLVVLTSFVNWIGDGMNVPRDLFWLAMYPLYQITPMVAIFVGSALPWMRVPRAWFNVDASFKIRFSILDLLILTFTSSMALSLFKLFPPTLILSEYQYTYAVDDSLRSLFTSSLAIAVTALIVARICLANEIRVWSLIVLFGFTLVGGVISTGVLGIRSNPLWSINALGPFLTAVLVAFTLLIQRHSESRMQIRLNQSTSSGETNNKILERSGRAVLLVPCHLIVAERSILSFCR